MTRGRCTGWAAGDRLLGFGGCHAGAPRPDPADDQATPLPATAALA